MGRLHTSGLLVLLACNGGVQPKVEPPTPGRRGPPGPIVVAEAWEKQGQRGTHLVFVGLDGRRKADLTSFAQLTTRRSSKWIPHRDLSPAWSPDGKWILFQSTRGRAKLTETSLWVIEAKPGRQPRRLTADSASDRDPVWSPDGKRIVFSSNRRGGWDLWRADVHLNRHGRLSIDSPVRITFDKGAEMEPSVSPDGKRIVYRASDVNGRSRLRLVAMTGGESIPLTHGPDDNSPAWSPKGDWIAFAAPAKRQLKRGAVRNLDLFLIKPDGTGRKLLWADSLFAIEMLPRWSKNGRYLFATSMLRTILEGKPILSSTVFIDLRESSWNARVLHDVVLSDRFGAALAPKVFNPTELLRNYTYKLGLKRVLNREIWRAVDRGARRKQ